MIYEGVPLLERYIELGNTQEVYCNCCGRPIVKTKIENTHTDYLHVEKGWGYFSAKDLTGHSFNICESCYDEWTSSFVIPVEEFPVDEISNYSDEEIERINAAYAAEFCK